MAKYKRLTEAIVYTGSYVDATTFVDEEGNIALPNEPYEIGENNFCCGHELKYDKKSKMYICEVCGQEYEAE